MSGSGWLSSPFGLVPKLWILQDLYFVEVDVMISVYHQQAFLNVVANGTEL